jgi:sortase A
MAGFTKGIRNIERLLLAAGVVFWAILATALVHRWIGSRSALQEFEAAQSAGANTAPLSAWKPEGLEAVDFSLWSEKRIRAYHESLARKEAALAVLSLSRLGIHVPVFAGTDEWVLNRGLGWIEGTARPGQAGNIGIAGHRDGFFRSLKDAVLGDTVELTTVQGAHTYQVDGIEIVTPDNVGVLQARAAPSVTLVTCYPFYFVGDAPQRYVLHAALRH